MTPEDWERVEIDHFRTAYRSERLAFRYAP
jgi:hypothetical protein